MTSIRPFPSPRLAAALLMARCLVAAAASAATLTVDTTADIDALDGACSLREAIVAANTNAGYQDCPAGSGPDDRIVFATTGTILLDSPLPDVTEGLTLSGPGRDELTIDGSDTWSILTVAAGHELVTLESLSMERGRRCLLATSPLVLRDFRAGFCTSDAGGAGLRLSAPGWLLRTWFHDHADSSNAVGGGAIYYAGTESLLIEDSTFSGNRAGDPPSTGSPTGGALRAYVASGQIIIRRSTFSGNSTTGSGGALALGSNSELHITASDLTVVGNQSRIDGSGVAGGGGIKLHAAVGSIVDLTLTGSIVANNTDLGTVDRAPDLAIGPVATVTTLGFNVLGDHESASSVFPAGLPNANGDFVGTASAPLDPQLEPLAIHGGAMPTHRPILSSSSPVIDQGRCPAALRDQRGHGNPETWRRIVDLAQVGNNPAGDGCDIGAFERGAAPLPIGVFWSDGFESGDTGAWSSAVP